VKPAVYLAGKIGQTDWRHGLVPTLRGHVWADGPIDAGDFLYCGPFFVSCDHACNHRPGSHGVAAGCTGQRAEFTRSDVVEQNNQALEAADLVFAYVSSPDCYGTLHELGWVVRAGKRVAVVFAPGMPVDDFWYVSEQADAVYTEQPAEALPHLLTLELRELENERRRGQRPEALGSVSDA
jgi:hypothetical protein